MFSQDSLSDGVFYLNNVWDTYFALDRNELGARVTTPFSKKDIVLFDVNNKLILNKYSK